MATVTENYVNATHEIKTNRTARTVSIAIVVNGQERCTYSMVESVCEQLEQELADARKSLPPKPPEEEKAP